MSDTTPSVKVKSVTPRGKASPKAGTRGGAKKQTEANRLLKLFEKDVPSILAKLETGMDNQIQLQNSILLVDEIKKWKETNNYDGTIIELISNKRKNDLLTQVWKNVDLSIKKGTTSSFIVPSFVGRLQRNLPPAIPEAEAVPMAEKPETLATEAKTMVAEQQSKLEAIQQGKVKPEGFVESEVERIERIKREASEEMGRMKLTGELDTEIDKRLEELRRQKLATQQGEGAGINPSTTTEQIAEEIASNQEGGEASTNEPELQTPREPEAEVEAEAEAEAQTENVTTEISKQATAEDRINIGKQVDDIPKETILSKIDESRFSTQFKTLAQLNEDIKYFISNFGNVLGKTLIEEYNKINKQNLAQVRRLHGKMSGVLQTDKKKEVKIGIIIDADEYIREKINMVIAQNATSGLKASGLIINVEGETIKEGDKSIGNFDVRKARLGGSLAYQREPVYRFIPKSDPQNVDLEERKKPTGRGIQMLGTKRIDLVSTARRQRANDPFAKSRNPIKLKYIY